MPHQRPWPIATNGFIFQEITPGGIQGLPRKAGATPYGRQYFDSVALTPDSFRGERVFWGNAAVSKAYSGEKMRGPWDSKFQEEISRMLYLKALHIGA